MPYARAAGRVLWFWLWTFAARACRLWSRAIAKAKATPRMTLSPLPLWSVALMLALTGCTPAPLPLAAPEPTLAGEIRQAAPKPAPGACWARQTRPAVIETVTEHVQASAERRDPTTGTVTRPASYRTETRQRIVEARAEQWFRTPCPEALTPDLIATLQRALKARGVYRGTVSGVMDASTKAAVRAWQTPRGLNSATLSLRAARDLGLLAWDGQ